MLTFPTTGAGPVLKAATSAALIAMTLLVGCATLPRESQAQRETGGVATQRQSQERVTPLARENTPTLPDDRLRIEAAALARSAGLPLIEALDTAVVRVWQTTAMAGTATLFELRPASLATIRIDGDHVRPSITVPLEDAERTMQRLSALALEDPVAFRCHRIKDGTSVIVEGTASGGVFRYDVSNPGVCADGPSRALADILAQLWAANPGG